MPLIGLSAQFIPYIMAVIFTMIFLNDNSVKTDNNIKAGKKVVSFQQIFSQNQNATPSEIHYTQEKTNYAAFVPANMNFNGDKKIWASPAFYQPAACDTFIQTISHRGPPTA